MIKIGCDPEVFVKNKKTGAFVSAHNYFPGTKREPHRIGLGAIQVDGVAFEFNINPASSLTEFSRNISVMTLIGNRYLQNANPDLVLELSPTATFDKEYFESLPPETKELGCEPDFSAWTGEPNPKPYTEEPFRTASGHVHIGWTEFGDIFSATHTKDCHDVVKQMDATIGVLSLLWDKDQKRRALYGQFGAYRPKSYGVEYRVLSNAWLRSQDTIDFIYKGTMKSMTLLDADVNVLDEVPSAVEMVDRIMVGELPTDHELQIYNHELSSRFRFPLFGA